MNYANLSEKSVLLAKQLLIKKSNVVIWGCGKNFENNKEKICQLCNVVAIYDSNIDIARKYTEFNLCRTKECIKSLADVVLITMSNENGCIEVAEILEALGVDYVFLVDLIGLDRRKNALAKYNGKKEYYCEYTDSDKLRAYIGINIPEYVCNLKCSYCYISQQTPKLPKITKMDGMAEYIGMALSKVNIGGTALVGLCGVGETFLGDGFVEICLELLRAGHYLHIVTNGLLTEKINELLERSGRYAAHIIFKMSFHYQELKTRNLLMKFVENINLIEESLASYTIELMPHDEIIPDIDDIIEFSNEHFGALPHVTVGRDDRDGALLLSRLSYAEYNDTWKRFESSLFNYKMKMYNERGRKCFSGKYGLSIDLESGNISRCSIVSEVVGNLYEMEGVNLEHDVVGEKCPLGYCYNCHVYGPLGIMCMEENDPTYLELRDREKKDGRHWIKEPMARFLSQKIYENY